MQKISIRSLTFVSIFLLAACSNSSGNGPGGEGGTTNKGGSSTTNSSGATSAGGSNATATNGGTSNSTTSAAPASGGAISNSSSTNGAGGTTASPGSAGGSVAAGGDTKSSSSGGSTAKGGTAAKGGSGNGGASTVTAGGRSTAAAGAGNGNGGSKPTGGTSSATTSAPSGGASVAGSSGGGDCPQITEFGTWDSGKAPLDIGKLAVNNFKSHTGDDYGGAGYAWTFAYFGSLQFTKLTGDATTNSKLIQDFEPYASGSKASPNNASNATVDDRAFGDLPLEIFVQNADDRCKKLGLDRADAQWASPGTDGITKDARYWIDDMYMITGLQVFAYRATKDSKYLDRAAKTMQAYIAALQQSDGLFWHTKQSKAYWGRANGWVASGMTELLLELPAGTVRDSIMTAYKKQMDGLLPKQITSGADAGCWRQVIDVATAAAESSCTAMFTYALVTGVKNGWLTDAKYITAARNGWIALGVKTNSGGMLDKVCPGTGQAPSGDLASQQKFYTDITLGSNDQHGQAPLLWAARALLRTDCPGKR